MQIMQKCPESFAAIFATYGFIAPMDENTQLFVLSTISSQELDSSTVKVFSKSRGTMKAFHCQQNNMQDMPVVYCKDLVCYIHQT